MWNVKNSIRLDINFCSIHATCTNIYSSRRLIKMPQICCLTLFILFHTLQRHRKKMSVHWMQPLRVSDRRAAKSCRFFLSSRREWMVANMLVHRLRCFLYDLCETWVHEMDTAIRTNFVDFFITAKCQANHFTICKRTHNLLELCSFFPICRRRRLQSSEYQEWP